jgi:hypothetical protein
LYESNHERAEEISKTLISMPVVAKYTTNLNGEPTFKGHEVSVDENGNVLFGTDTVGTHTETYIKNDEVKTVSGEIKNLPCLFAKYRLWKRNANVCAAAKRLFEIGKLYSSWELAANEYEYKDGIKTITDYSFLGNALLGFENSFPAYGTSARAISLSSEMSPELMIAGAFAQDIDEQKLIQKEENDLKDKKTDVSEVLDTSKVTEVDEQTKDTATEDPTKDEAEVNPVENTTEKDNAPEAEVSALTVSDMYEKISNAARAKLGTWCYVAWLFPNERVAWVRSGDAENELDYKKFTYVVSNDEVSLSEPQDVKLTVSISEVNQKVSDLNEAVAEANATIQTLNTEISNLTVFKEKFEASEQERIEAEVAEKQSSLKDYALSSGLIAEDEIESDENIKTAISSVDKASIDAIIAERFMASKAEKKEKSSIETSEKKTKKAEEVKVNLATSDAFADAVAEFKKTFINKN